MLHRPRTLIFRGLPIVALTSLLLSACAPSLTVDFGASVQVTATPTASGILVVRVPSPRKGGAIEVRQASGATFKIPPGHFPPPGSCRIWYPNTPPGQQPAPGACSELERRVPAGAYLVYG